MTAVRGGAFPRWWCKLEPREEGKVQGEALVQAVPCVGGGGWGGGCKPSPFPCCLVHVAGGLVGENMQAALLFILRWAFPFPTTPNSLPPSSFPQAPRKVGGWEGHLLFCHPTSSLLPVSIFCTDSIGLCRHYPDRNKTDFAFWRLAFTYLRFRWFPSRPGLIGTGHLNSYPSSPSPRLPTGNSYYPQFSFSPLVVVTYPQFGLGDTWALTLQFSFASWAFGAFTTQFPRRWICLLFGSSLNRHVCSSTTTDFSTYPSSHFSPPVSFCFIPQLLTFGLVLGQTWTPGLCCLTLTVRLHGASSPTAHILWVPLPHAHTPPHPHTFSPSTPFYYPLHWNLPISPGLPAFLAPSWWLPTPPRPPPHTV